ncbi:hypothetical protein [Streptomyces sp. NPDC055134]
MNSVTTEDLGGMGPLVARFGRAGERLRRADQARPWVLDTAVVVLVFLMFCLPDLLHGGVGDDEVRAGSAWRSPSSPRSACRPCSGRWSFGGGGPLGAAASGVGA